MNHYAFGFLMGVLFSCPLFMTLGYSVARDSKR